jgi:hypothetical protein
VPRYGIGVEDIPLYYDKLNTNLIHLIFILTWNNDQLSFQSLHLSWIGIEGDFILCPSLVPGLLSIAEMKTSSILLQTMVLVNWNSIIDLNLKDIEWNSVARPTLVGRFHGGVEIEPGSSIGVALVIVELIEWN